MADLVLADGFSFDDLYSVDGLARLDAAFMAGLDRERPDLAKRLKIARLDSAFEASLDAGHQTPVAGERPGKDDKDAEQAALLIDLGPYLEDFLGRLFGIETELRALAERHNELAPLYSVKRQFVQRRAGKQVKPEAAQALDGDALRQRLDDLGAPPDEELVFARQVSAWLDAEADHGEALEVARDYAAWALYHPEGQARHAGGVLFHQPHKLDPLNLIALEEKAVDGVWAQVLPEDRLRHRDGFALTDAGMDLTQALDHVNYCILCHHQGKDSCSKGLKDREGSFKKSAFDVSLVGCPLEEKISEMHEVKRDGHAVAALAIAVIDNPMIAGTGHRICNDCMKACIYQKQDPVDIPQAETRILKDVLELPWGFEIYGLLTRWNPLKLRRFLPRAASGRKVLISGLGPAGYTLAHYLLNEGHAVVAIDGLKIEPLDAALSGVEPDGTRVPFLPIRDWDALREPLDERVMAGFGGVAEYGITVRWDKTFLKVIRLLLERRAQFAMFGGVRFGGTITLDEAFDMGFDHVALAVGAGRPTVLPISNGLARGVRAASDFLMALQLTGAAKTESIANMQLRLPVVVIGGGLTAIDTATEALAYYPVQVEKFLTRYERLVGERGEAAVRAGWGEEEAVIADEFLTHGRAIRDERADAAAEGRAPRIRELLDSWGGVTIAYRKRLIDAPSYTLNHEEVAKALEEGIRIVDCHSPLTVDVDPFGHARAIRLNRLQHVREGTGWITLDTVDILRARSVLVAAGTQPNTVLAREHPDEITLDRRTRPAGHAGTLGQARSGPRPRPPARGRPRGQLLGRRPSLLCRQRGQGHGQRQAGLPHRLAPADPPPASRRGKRGGLGGPARRPVAGAGRCGEPPHPDHRRSGGPRAGGGAGLPSRPVLPPAELRDPSPEGRRHDPGHGGPRHDRRLGRPGGRPARTHRARDGRLLGHLRAPQGRRAGHRHGADRRADGNRRRRDGGACRRRTRQRGAVLDRPGVPRSRQ
jgi:NADPH-dependent glutamate synthase beta subunit-like oxidoreductase